MLKRVQPPNRKLRPKSIPAGSLDWQKYNISRFQRIDISQMFVRTEQTVYVHFIESPNFEQRHIVRGAVYPANLIDHDLDTFISAIFLKRSCHHNIPWPPT